MSYKFEKTINADNKFSNAKIIFEVENDDIELDSLLEEFKYFLLASGFSDLAITDRIKIK
jgi:hypothetical protein